MRSILALTSLLAVSCSDPTALDRVVVVGGEVRTIRLTRLAGEEVPIELWNRTLGEAVVSKVQSSCGCASMDLQVGTRISADSRLIFRLLISLNVGEERRIIFNIAFGGDVPQVLLRLNVQGPLDDGAKFDRERDLTTICFHRPTTFEHAVRFTMHSEEEFEELARVARWLVERGPEVELVKTEVLRDEKVLNASFKVTPKYIGRGEAAIALLLRQARIPTRVKWESKSELGLPDVLALRPANGRMHASFTVAGNESDSLRVVDDANRRTLECRVEWRHGRWCVDVTGGKPWLMGEVSKETLLLIADSWPYSAKVVAVAGL